MASRLRDKEFLADIGGEARLEELSARILTSGNIDSYASMVFEKSKMRSLINCGAKLQHLGHQVDRTLEEVLDEAEQEVFAATYKSKKTGPKSAAEILAKLSEQTIERHQTGVVPGLKSGFHDLDAMTQGFQPTDLIILAARPAMGKSSLAMAIAANVSALHDNLAVIFSLEMSEEQVMTRLVSADAQIPSQRIRAGNLYPDEWNRFGESVSKIGKLKLHVDETHEITVGEIRSRSRQLAHSNHGKIGCIVIDYLQIMGGADSDRVQSLSQVTRSLKGLAKELKCPIILLSQLNRDVEIETTSGQ